MYPYNMSNKQQCYSTGKLKPEEKLMAIERILNGESKASVSRSINVPESTLRGWVKNAEKIRFTVDRILFTKRTRTEIGNGKDSLGKKDVIRSHQRKEEPLKSTSLSGDMALNPSPSHHHRPWISTEPSTSKNGGNQFGLNNPSLPIPRYSPSNVPISTTTPVVSTTAEYKTYKDLEQSLFCLWQHRQINQTVVERIAPTPSNVPLDLRLRIPEGLSICKSYVVPPVGMSIGSVPNLNNTNKKRMADTSPTRIDCNAPLNLRLPEGLSIRPNPVVSPIGTSSGSVLDSNNNKSSTSEDLNIRPNHASPPVRTSCDSVLNSNNSNNDANNNNPVVVQKRGNSDHIIDSMQALWYAERFSSWFETYTDPTITIQDFVKFQELLGRVKKIAKKGEL